MSSARRPGNTLSCGKISFATMILAGGEVCFGQQREAGGNAVVGTAFRGVGRTAVDASILSLEGKQSIRTGDPGSNDSDADASQSLYRRLYAIALHDRSHPRRRA